MAHDGEYHDDIPKESPQENVQLEEPDEYLACYDQPSSSSSSGLQHFIDLENGGYIFNLYFSLSHRSHNFILFAIPCPFTDVIFTDGDYTDDNVNKDQAEGEEDGHVFKTYKRKRYSDISHFDLCYISETDVHISLQECFAHQVDWQIRFMSRGRTIHYFEMGKVKG